MREAFGKYSPLVLSVPILLYTLSQPITKRIRNRRTSYLDYVPIYIANTENLQGESGGEGNILGDDSVDHCKKSLYKHNYYSQ